MAWPAWAGATESTPSASLVNMNGQQSAVSPGAGASTTRLSDRRDRSMGGIGQDLWQETEGGTAQHGPVAGETRSSRPRSRRARTTILSERQYHGPVLRPVRERAGSRRRLNPHPPRDTDGRREGSGRGVRELPGRWPGLHWGRWEVGGRSSVAAQGPYGRLRSCDARDGERIRSRERSRTGVARVCGDVGSVAGWPSGREWNGSQPGQGASELGFPRPAPGEMQSEAARRAGDPSGQGEEPPPEGLGGYAICSPRPIRAVQRARLCAITWTASQAPLAGKRPDGMWFSPTPYLRSRMAFSTSAWRR